MVLVSAVMSVYKEPVDWLVESINSILNQTYSDFEFIIIIDNPRYNEAIELISEFCKKDSRINVIINDENIGLTKALNKGMALAKGKYIARMDADDISYSTRFEKQVDFMECNPNIVVCGTGITRFGGRYDTTLYESDPKKNYTFFTFPNPYLSPFAHPTVFIRKSVLNLYNIKYNEEFITSQDFGLWNELIFLGEFSNLDEVLLKYRVSENSISKSKREDQINNTEKIVIDHVRRWLTVNKIELIDDVNPDFLIKIAKKRGEGYDIIKISAMAYGLLMNRQYSFWYTFRFFMKNRNVNVSLLLKAKLLVKKILKRY